MTAPRGRRTLAIDIGGTGLKAVPLDSAGAMVGERARIPTPYPLSPERLVEVLTGLVTPMRPFARVSAGFPGVVRGGLVRTAPHFVSRTGPGGKRDGKLARAWAGFPLADALATALGVPARVANDADIQGAAVITGAGIELVVTLGTGVGTALFADGRLAPHLELAQHPLHKDKTYNERLGDAARRKAGGRRWQERVLAAFETLDVLVNYDRLFVGGGNAVRLTGTLPPKVTVVSNDAGMLGGIKLWDTRVFPDVTSRPPA